MVRLGQNFLVDSNLLDAIVRDAALAPEDVVLEVGAGEGVLTKRLAPAAAHLHSVEIDRGLESALAPVGALENVTLHWGDAMKLDFTDFDPPPTAVVANLPYAVATPVILRTIEQLPTVRSWTVMVQREIADRLRAAPGSRVYGSPSALAQIACEVELARKVDPAVFRPRPRVDSAILRLRRIGLPPTRRRGSWFAAPSPTVASPLPGRWNTPGPARSAPPALPWPSWASHKTLAQSSFRPRSSRRCRGSWRLVPDLATRC